MAGICGGFAERWGWKPRSVRLLFAVATLLPLFPGLPVYLILWLLTPLEASPSSPEAPEPE